MANDVQLIIDAGATKTEFVLLKNSETLHRFVSTGINANYATDEEMDTIFNRFITSLASIAHDNIAKVIYYGAGCANEQNALRIGTVMMHYFPDVAFKVYSDLMGACHALCGTDSGLVAILGTGSSSCLYDGKNIVKRAPSLGYLIGDEGSGTHLGKKLITAYLMERFPQELAREFEKEFSLDFQKVMRRIYRTSAPNRFFASFAPFIQAHISDLFIKQLCNQAFGEFFDTQIAYYDLEKEQKLNLIGTVAFQFKEPIEQMAVSRNIKIGKVISAP
ncbi:MAG: BadF/BadG/BcrA/BcrD ATPase family protein, partial [Bacteroidales bacterium]